MTRFEGENRGQKAEKINILIIEGFVTILFQKRKKSSQNQK